MSKPKPISVRHAFVEQVAAELAHDALDRALRALSPAQRTALRKMEVDRFHAAAQAFVDALPLSADALRRPARRAA
jgi:hypothetical protein